MEANKARQPAAPASKATDQLSAIGYRLSAISCPWCESERVEQVGAVGSHLMVAQYICLACRSPFELIRR